MRRFVPLLLLALPACGSGDEPWRLWLGLDAAGPPVPHPGSTVLEDSKLTPVHGGYDAAFGSALDGAGDVNGDGYDDLIVGSPGYSVGMGMAYLFTGSASGIDSSAVAALMASDAAILDRFGAAVAGAGDVDGDGYDDVIVGAYESDDGGSGAGSVYLYRGGASGIDLSSELELSASDASSDAYFGRAVAGVGDVNGDGYDDVVVGAEGDDDSTGAAYLYLAARVVST